VKCRAIHCTNNRPDNSVYCAECLLIVREMTPALVGFLSGRRDAPLASLRDTETAPLASLRDTETARGDAREMMGQLPPHSRKSTTGVRSTELAEGRGR
jgi:hypothetical protein